ncbi:MAG: hypothetical protein M3552_11730 [Planctomycetota bacterium]|nr:hypothetical protein [Planctomycetaceae bacterium]MDQ3331304.1 hypothetical protein [Planctomycetota bacterium]
MRTTPKFPLLAALLGLGLLWLSGLPLWHTDLWGHLAYGRYIWDTGSLPATEPFMPLARGVEFVDTAWLSQVIGYLALQRLGLPGLQFLAAACVTATAGVLAWLGVRKTGHVGWTLLGLAAFAWLNWKQLFNGSDLSVVIRPQMAGMLAFVVTLAVAVGKPSRWHWFLIPLTFTAWANLHGSFLAGLALLGIFAVGRAGDVLRRTDKFGATLRDWKFWRLILLLEIAAVAVLLNPYGLRLYADAYLLVKNANLQNLVEWQPLTLRMQQGKAAAGVAFVLLFLYRMTPRRIGTGEVLALLILGGLALWTSRMIIWWAPVAAYCVMLHSAALWRAYRRHSVNAPTPLSLGRGGLDSPSILCTIVGVAIIAACFAFTPLAKFLVTGPRPEFGRAVSSQTPTGAARHLTENPARGQVFNTYEYGDYLLWSNPGMPVFVAGHAHLVPTEVWKDYVASIRGSDWETTFDRYGVETVVLDRPARQAFIDRLREEPDWNMTYEDRNSAVFRRTRPLR